MTLNPTLPGIVILCGQPGSLLKVALTKLVNMNKKTGDMNMSPGFELPSIDAPKETCLEPLGVGSTSIHKTLSSELASEVGEL